MELDVDGPAAPPRSNGELVFDAPWQCRIFGLTHALCDQGALSWDEFRERLITRISASDRAHEPGDEDGYWECWLEALEALLDAKGLCARDRLRERVTDYAARPHGHDH